MKSALRQRVSTIRRNLKSAFSSTRPATFIHTLPPEILRIIFEMGIESDDGRESFGSMTRGYKFLLPVCLVCSTWNREGRALLWKMVAVWYQNDSRLLQGSPALGRYPIETLWVFDGPTTVKSSRALSDCRRIICSDLGLRNLKLNPSRIRT